MATQKLKYEFTPEVVQFLLSALEKVQVSGVQTAEALVAVNRLLKEPLNMEELEEEQLKSLEAKLKKKEKK